MIVGDQVSMVFEEKTAALGHLVAGSIENIDYDGCGLNFLTKSAEPLSALAGQLQKRTKRSTGKAMHVVRFFIRFTPWYLNGTVPAIDPR